MANSHRLDHAPVRGFMTRDVVTAAPESPTPAVPPADAGTRDSDESASSTSAGFQTRTRRTTC